MLPNGDRINSMHEALLPLPNLPQRALKVHLFPVLKGQAVLLIGTFCDAGAQTATFPRMDIRNWQHRQTTWVEFKSVNWQPDGVMRTKQQKIMY
jgi:hypothetical protein